MVLLGVIERNKWLNSRWELTYRVGWDQILKACAFSFQDFDDFEVLVDDKPVSVKSRAEYLLLDEGGSLTFRGISKMIKVPIMTTFHNQTGLVDVTVGMRTDEFSAADYEKFNKSLGQYLNSIELAMYRPISDGVKSN